MLAITGYHRELGTKNIDDGQSNPLEHKMHVGCVPLRCRPKVRVFQIVFYLRNRSLVSLDIKRQSWPIIGNG